LLDFPAKPYSEVNGMNNNGDVAGDFSDNPNANLIGFVAFRK
jgi:hypothetical protein